MKKIILIIMVIILCTMQTVCALSEYPAEKYISGGKSLITEFTFDFRHISDLMAEIDQETMNILNALSLFRLEEIYNTGKNDSGDVTSFISFILSCESKELAELNIEYNSEGICISSGVFGNESVAFSTEDIDNIMTNINVDKAAGSIDISVMDELLESLASAVVRTGQRLKSSNLLYMLIAGFVRRSRTEAISVGPENMPEANIAFICENEDVELLIKKAADLFLPDKININGNTSQDQTYDMIRQSFIALLDQVCTKLRNKRIIVFANTSSMRNIVIEFTFDTNNSYNIRNGRFALKADLQDIPNILNLEIAASLSDMTTIYKFISEISKEKENTEIVADVFTEKDGRSQKNIHFGLECRSAEIHGAKSESFKAEADILLNENKTEGISVNASYDTEDNGNDMRGKGDLIFESAGEKGVPLITVHIKQETCDGKKTPAFPNVNYPLRMTANELEQFTARLSNNLIIYMIDLLNDLPEPVKQLLLTK